MPAIQIKQRPKQAAPGLSSLPQPIAAVLAARGVEHINDLDYSLKQLLPPNQLTGIQEAADLLAEAVTAGASIVIVGDFDADGATSCALAVKCLRAFGLENVTYLVPNRFEYGYGLSPEIVGVAAIEQPDIIITVDNGISSVDGVHAAQQLGMSVLITDHHLPGETIPTADVIVNPNLPGDLFPSKNLAGVGVIFYVMLALRSQLRKIGWFTESGLPEPNMSQFLDLVALGTVADVVPLDKNNRILVQQGLQRIRHGKACVGIQALLTVSQRNPHRLTSSDLGFAIGPRLNAAGRLDDISIGIECLLSEDENHATKLAMQLDQLNRERREVELSMQEDALAIVDGLCVDNSALPVIYALHDATWHQGVVGLVASRIKEQTHRPVIALAPADNEQEWKGSARSIEGVHMRDLLARVDALYPNLMSKYGGHAMAAGLSLPKENLLKFTQVLPEVTEQFTKNQDWRQSLWSDGALSADQLTFELADQLRQITPWGQAFPEPLFDGEFDVLEARLVGEIHAKLVLQPVNGSAQLNAIFFGYLSHYEALPNGRIHAAYRLDINEFRDQLSLQLIVQHIAS